jgi:hypothetical protein
MHDAPMSLTQSLRLTSLVLNASARHSHDEVLWDRHHHQVCLRHVPAHPNADLLAPLLVWHKPAIKVQLKFFEFVGVQLQYPHGWAPPVWLSTPK